MNKIAMYEALLEDHPLWQDEKTAAATTPGVAKFLAKARAAQGRAPQLGSAKALGAAKARLSAAKASGAMRTQKVTTPLLQRPAVNLRNLLNKSR